MKPPRQRAGECLRGQVALVTGATRGIGLAIARALAAEGCELVLTARNQTQLDRLCKEFVAANKKVLAVSSDIRDPVSVGTLFRSIRKQYKRIDILINNAGIAHPNASVAQLSYPVWKDVMATNLDGMFLVSQAALALMRPGGTIVNNLSIAATRVFPGSAAYNASKHGALGLTNTLREELRPKGIRVIGLLPGATDTDIWKTFWPAAPRGKTMSAATVAQIVVQAILLPSNATVENLEIMPSVGTL
jgi:NAD(P)-dependent dehydrogenase (short-subunit alcohol dehydrogenase family)